ncbi:hypothetical protein PTSG_01783 [Salpingoeca rosetta]|uniref:Nudix hydrolase domain-containing protein n=1 Tax=Salpingoeca rosetta (strain ATCC 50818 / BSB-021) TaxID=946362 RepID=F2TYY4_SALR5|nr:uncharacterized protein PTSG_01783 [Salpingoeca rosetta]EGD78808.1 hypothetical protein PTSG_01783 [Salpingoeca rosetta]|eukprot:XP_004997764.1 hypothetical protein PTSG_01783 [Salpingoeca rosetta]
MATESNDLRPKVAVTAAGGWVENGFGEILWLLRAGKWDLPKGRLEAGETVPECAVREVKEECGLTEVQRGEKIIETVHEYEQNDRRFVKTTHWFRMSVLGRPPISPQADENIDRVAWLPHKEWLAVLDSTFPSVRKVVAAVSPSDSPENRLNNDTPDDNTTTTTNNSNSDTNGGDNNDNNRSNSNDATGTPHNSTTNDEANTTDTSDMQTQREDADTRISPAAATANDPSRQRSEQAKCEQQRDASEQSTAMDMSADKENGVDSSASSSQQHGQPATSARDAGPSAGDSRAGALTATRLDDDGEDDGFFGPRPVLSGDRSSLRGDESPIIGPQAPPGLEEQQQHEEMPSLSEEATRELQATLVPCPVKLYKQGGDQWDEQPEGTISLDLADNLHLTITATDSSETLFDLHLTEARSCQIQQAFVLLGYGEPEEVVAISFNDDDACAAYSNAICTFLQADTASDDDMLGEPDNNLFTPVDLPPPDLAHLDAYDKFLTEVLDIRQQSMSTQNMDMRREALMKIKGFGHHMLSHVDTFFDTFEKCDDLEDDKALGTIYNISLVMLLSCMPELFDLLTPPQYLERFIGTLETKPDGSKTEHREHLNSDTRFQEIEPLNDDDLRFRIRQLYYITYLKDVILAGFIDDQLPFVLDSHAIFASGAILEKLVTMPTYLKSILSADPGQSQDRTRKQAMFLLEVFTVSGNQQSVDKPVVYKALADSGLYNVINICLQSDHKETRHNAVCAVCKALENNTPSIRQIIHKNEWALPSELIRAFAKETSIATLTMLSHALEMLYDVDTFIDAEATKSALLNMLYNSDVLFPRLVSLFSMPPDEMRTPHGREKLVILMQLISHWLPTHTYHIKSFVTTKNLLGQAAKVVKANDKLLTLAFARLLSHVVQTKNTLFYRKLVAGNLMEPVMKAFNAVKHRYNMLTSTVLSIIEFTATNNLPAIRDYLVKNFRQILENIDQHPCGKNLVLRFEQRFDESAAGSLGNGGGTTVAAAAAAALRSRFRKDGSMTEEEENYFSEDSIDADESEQRDDQPRIIMPNQVSPSPPPPPSHRRPLVSYDDDDDDDDDDEEESFLTRARVLKKPKFTFAIGTKTASSMSDDKDQQHSRREGVSSSIFPLNT